MAAGLTVVVSHVVGASRELIEDKSTGRIFTAGCLDELIAAILDVTDPANLARYQIQSQQALAKWTQSCNPIAEIRRALVESGAFGAQGV
jgi:hypothetical protein